MEPFLVHRGVAAPMLQPNIDTDAIIPSREMKRVSKQGLGEGLFAGRRYIQAGSRELAPDFVLNRPEYAGCTILLAGDNFGCGSSREHAVWALAEFGIRAIIAPGFGGIFYGNCTRNGILPVRLPESVIDDLVSQVKADPQQQLLEIDLPNSVVNAPDGSRHVFELEGAPRQMLQEGLDPIALTLKMDEQISAFATKRKAAFPWFWSS
ncbi:MAG: 3-isopropylmalate dehydratase small subunit [Halioglobus sp.]